jgi:hypothetical protein
VAGGERAGAVWAEPGPDQRRVSLAGSAAVDHAERLGATDGDLAGLHRLRHFADQIDHQQAVFQPGALDADEIGQFEATLKTALRDAQVEELPGILGFFGLAALDHQQVLLRGDVDLGRLETGDGKGDAIGILIAAFDVEGG